jgi:hypothetical protein
VNRGVATTGDVVALVFSASTTAFPVVDVGDTATVVDELVELVELGAAVDVVVDGDVVLVVVGAAVVVVVGGTCCTSNAPASQLLPAGLVALR